MNKNNIAIKLLCISLIIIILGGVIATIGAINGAHLSISQSRHGIFNTIKWGNPYEHKYYTNDSYFAQNEVKRFILDIDLGSVEISKDATFSMATEKINQNDVSIKEENGEYHCTIKQNDINITGNNDAGKVYVKIPESVEEIIVNQSLGEVNVENLTLAHLKIDSKLGDIHLDQVFVDKAELLLDLGALDFSGDFKKQLTISNKMGNVNLDLSRSESDYNYDIKVKMGETIINGYDHGSINAHYEHHNNQSSSLKADLDMGSIDIEFE